MTDPTRAQHIASVGTVFVTVSDQEAALGFYRDTLGFEVRMDMGYGDGQRWVAVAPPGADTTVALVPPMEDGDVRPGGTLGFAYDTDDLDAAVAALSARGVEFEELVRLPPPVPPMVFFHDVDGNRVLLVQRGG